MPHLETSPERSLRAHGLKGSRQMPCPMALLFALSLIAYFKMYLEFALIRCGKVTDLETTQRLPLKEEFIIHSSQREGAHPTMFGNMGKHQSGSGSRG